MGWKRHGPAEVIEELRKAEVLMAKGAATAEVAEAIGAVEWTYDRWRREHGGTEADRVRRLRELERENRQLRRAVLDLALDKSILTEAARGNDVRRAYACPYRRTCRNGASVACCAGIRPLRGRRRGAV